MAASAKKITSRVLTCLLLVALIVGGVFAYLNRQQINDHFAAQRFEPTAQIETLTTDLHLTEAGHRIFWASAPTLDASQNFNQHAPEIAQAMLQRQQASAIIAAREKIVEGAVTMVEQALSRLESDGVVVLDDERRAQMVSNLLLVLTSEQRATPVINAGSLY